MNGNDWCLAVFAACLFIYFMFDRWLEYLETKR